LDQQLVHLNQISLFQLGKWWKRKKESLQKKRKQALADIENCGTSKLGLRTQWQLQQYEVLKKAPGGLVLAIVSPYSSVFSP